MEAHVSMAKWQQSVWMLSAVCGWAAARQEKLGPSPVNFPAAVSSYSCLARAPLAGILMVEARSNQVDAPCF